MGREDRAVVAGQLVGQEGLDMDIRVVGLEAGVEVDRLGWVGMGEVGVGEVELGIREGLVRMGRWSLLI
jgi:hypothetical protein